MPLSRVTSQSIEDQTIATNDLADNAVNSAKIGADVIVAEDVANNAITTAQISNDAVTADKIADDAVTLAKANDNFFKTGTFSVVFRDSAASSGNDSQTFANQTYTKIGNIVHINVFCENINRTGMTASNDLYMHGLPFNPSKTAYGAVWHQDINISGSAHYSVFFVATAGGNHGYFSSMRDNDAADTMDVDQFEDDQADIAFQMSYFTNE